MAQASADLTGIVNHMATVRPQDYPAQFQVFVMPIGHSVTGHIEATLYIVLVAVGLLLLIGCVNVANLMLARATSREKEFALRTVLGAGRARLMRLLLVESLVLAMGGAFRWPYRLPGADGNLLSPPCRRIPSQRKP